MKWNILTFPRQVRSVNSYFPVLPISHAEDGWYGSYDDIARYAISTGVFTDFHLSLTITDLALGPDGAIWALLSTNNASNAFVLARISYDGVVTSFSLNALGRYGTVAFCLGPDNNFWLTTNGDYEIARVTPTGVMSIFHISLFDQLLSIVAGADGALWFTSYNTNQIGRMTTTGVVTLYTIPSAKVGPTVMVRGASDDFWFLSDTNQLLWRITTRGVITPYTVALVSQSANIQRQYDLALGPDGCIWYTDMWGISIGRFNPSDGTSREYVVPIYDARPIAITPGPDGALWFLQEIAPDLGRITP